MAKLSYIIEAAKNIAKYLVYYQKPLVDPKWAQAFLAYQFTGKVTIVARGLFLGGWWSCNLSGNKEIFLNTGDADDWESFYVEQLDDGFVLKNMASHPYVRVEADGAVSADGVKNSDATVLTIRAT